MLNTCCFKTIDESNMDRTREKQGNSKTIGTGRNKNANRPPRILGNIMRKDGLGYFTCTRPGIFKGSSTEVNSD